MSQGAKAFALAIVALIAIGTYFTYSVHQKRVQQQAIADMVGQATAQLGDVLSKGASTAHVSEMEAIVEALGALKTGRDRPLAEAAELYLFSARAIVQRVADRARNSEQAVRARQALAGHMGGRSRGESWIRDAVELKRRAERAYFDLDVSLKALLDLLMNLPDNQKPLTSRIDPALVLDEPVRQAALKQTRADIARAETELANVRGLPAPR
jgi:hypothetical protein